MPVKIFFCYAHEDEELLHKLKAHLMPLQRQGLIDVWHDRDIGAGAEWEREINKHLDTADIILLLISSDFIASEYCYSKEMKRAIEHHERGEARVIPIILRPVYWQKAPFSKLQALPTDAKPVMSPDWSSKDEALFNVAEGIRKAVTERAVKTSSEPGAVHETVPPLQQTQPKVIHQKRLSRRLALLLLVFICVGILSLGIFALLTKHIRPGGAWRSPLNGETVHGTIHFSAYAFPTYPGDPTIDHVNFTAFWQGGNPRTWEILCVASVATQNNIFSCDANPGALGAPAGPMKIGFDVYDKQGNTNYSPNGEHTILYTPT